jgi:hypothetical protein
MNYAVYMGSDAMIDLPSFIKIGQGVQKFLRGGIHVQTHRHTDTQTARWSHNPTSIFPK